MNDDEFLPIGSVRVVRNASRGEIDGPNHPKVKQIAETIKSQGLQHPIKVRPLDPPVSRPCGGPCCAGYDARSSDDDPTHDYDLVLGFRRYVALRSLGRTELRLSQPNVEVTISEPMTDEEADDANFVENFVRGDPTEAAIGRFLCAKMKKGATAAELAKKYAAPSVYRVESITRIVSRCPEDLIAEWDRRDSDPRYRRALDRISRLDFDGRMREEDRHDHMRRAFSETIELFEQDDRLKAQQAE
jgi:ParB-like chromosome segregation protein Spo0J